MRNPHGYGQLVSPVKHRVGLDRVHAVEVGEGTTEFDTCQCSHCQRHFHVGPGTRPEDLGGFCRQCMRAICDRCVGKPCIPFLKQMEEAEQRDYIRRQYEMMMSS